VKIMTLLAGAAVALSGTASFALDQISCDKLKSLSLRNTTITAADFVPEGPYKLPGIMPGAQAPPPVQLPAHCRVALVLTPSKNSYIESEFWLPAENWHGKLEVVGNGGWAGSLSYFAMAPALSLSAGCRK
jgi:feruloyl esterase